MFYTFKNSKVLLNNVSYYCKSATLSEQSAIEPSYDIEHKYNTNYVASDGLGNSFSLSYALTGVDPLASYISLDEEPIRIDFGGLSFNSGYLKKYGFGLEPNKPLIINAELVFFDTATGTFNPN